MLGFVLVFFAYVCLSLQNVLIRIIFAPSSVLDWLTLGGWASPTIGHSLLVLLLRSVFMLPLMIVIAPTLYPPTKQDLKQLVTAGKRPILWKTIASSAFLFLALALLFISFSQVSAGIGTALFLIHPAVTVLLAWQIFGDRPTPLRFVVIVAVFVGSFLVAPGFMGTADSNILLGVGAGLAAGAAYAIQTVLAQICIEDVHPVPFTIANLLVMFALSGMGTLWFQINIAPSAWTPIWVTGLIGAVLTLAGQLLINFGIQVSNASLASLVGASNPALTALFAWLLIQEALQGRQILGIVIVTLGVAALGIEQMRR